MAPTWIRHSTEATSTPVRRVAPPLVRRALRARPFHLHEGARALSARATRPGRGGGGSKTRRVCVAVASSIRDLPCSRPLPLGASEPILEHGSLRGRRRKSPDTCTSLDELASQGREKPSSSSEATNQRAADEGVSGAIVIDDGASGCGRAEGKGLGERRASRSRRPRLSARLCARSPSAGFASAGHLHAATVRR